MAELKAFADEGLNQRFWAKVNITEGCWLWTASKTGVGYGQISIKCKPELVHRLIFELYCGPIPKGLFVLHKCDVRHCCNPEHLFLGTPADNTADMMKKGRQKHPGAIRQAKRERHGRHKLTEIQVREIRQRFSTGCITQVQLGEEYGVSGAHICGIVRGKFWKEDVQALRDSTG